MGSARRSRKRVHRDLDRPVTFHADGKRLATLREHLDPRTPTKSHVELSREQLAAVVARRLEAEPDDFEIAMFGVGPINKQRALYEIQRGTRIGRQLIEIERRAIAHAAASPSRGGRAPRR